MQPTPYQPSPPEAIAELQALNQWVVYRKHPTKIPYNPVTGTPAKSNEPATWATYRAAMLKRPRYDGIGVMLFTPYFYVDLDHCRDPITGAVHPDALTIIRGFNTYTEISQSLAGVKLIGRCNAFPSNTGKNFRPRLNHPDYPANRIITWPGGVEMYGAKPRLFCFTGKHLAGSPKTINNAGSALHDLYQRLMPRSETVLCERKYIGDEAIGDRMKRCLAYVRKMPLAISGQNGHGATFSVACQCIRFDLSDSESLQVLHDYNARLDEKWTEAELVHKLMGAKREAAGQRGDRFREDRPQSRRRFMGIYGGHHAVA